MADKADDLLELAVASACGLAGGSAAVRSISVVGGRRLTVGKLMRLNERAAACGTKLTMDGYGVVTLRGHRQRIGCGAAEHSDSTPAVLPATPAPAVRHRRIQIFGQGIEGMPVNTSNGGGAGWLEEGWTVDQAIEIACLAGAGAIGSIHVATSQRPTYAELRRLREMAIACGFTLTLTGKRVILRPRSEPLPTSADQVGSAGLRALVTRLSDRALRRWPLRQTPARAVARSHRRRRSAEPDGGCRVRPIDSEADGCH